MSRSRHAGGHSRRRQAPCFEGLEARQVPSTYVGVFAKSQLIAERNAVTTTETLANQGSTVSTAASLGSPTPRELKRQHFVAKFKGIYYVGPPQFTNESKRIFINASGGSNQIFRANALVAINLPADPTQATTRATANVFGRDIATTGSDLIMDLTAPAAGTTTALPTHLTWTINGGSAGTYSGAALAADPNNPVAVVPGTLTITYLTAHRGGTGGSLQTGTALLVFKASIITTGVGDIGTAYGTPT